MRSHRIWHHLYSDLLPTTTIHHHTEVAAPSKEQMTWKLLSHALHNNGSFLSGGPCLYWFTLSQTVHLAREWMVHSNCKVVQVCVHIIDCASDIVVLMLQLLFKQQVVAPLPQTLTNKQTSHVFLHGIGICLHNVWLLSFAAFKPHTPCKKVYLAGLSTTNISAAMRYPECCILAGS